MSLTARAPTSDRRANDLFGLATPLRGESSLTADGGPATRHPPRPPRWPSGSARRLPASGALPGRLACVSDRTPRLTAGHSPSPADTRDEGEIRRGSSGKEQQTGDHGGRGKNWWQGKVPGFPGAWKSTINSPRGDPRVPARE